MHALNECFRLQSRDSLQPAAVLIPAVPSGLQPLQPVRRPCPLLPVPADGRSARTRTCTSGPLERRQTATTGDGRGAAGDGEAAAIGGVRDEAGRPGGDRAGLPGGGGQPERALLPAADQQRLRVREPRAAAAGHPGRHRAVDPAAGQPAALPQLQGVRLPPLHQGGRQEGLGPRRGWEK